MNELQRVISAEEFAVIFARMASQLRWIDHRPSDIANFYDVLRDLPIGLIHESAKQLASQANRKFFPTTAEWRGKALDIEGEQRRAAIVGERVWKTECDTCEDTGWESFYCPGDETCERKKSHLPHNYVRPCICRSTNATYQRHHAPRERAE